MAKHIIKTVDTEELANESGYKIARTAIFYAAASLAIAAMLVPWTNSSPELMASFLRGSVDDTVTGSVEKPNRRTRIRRSVLQSDPKLPCYVLANGKTENDC